MQFCHCPKREPADRPWQRHSGPWQRHSGVLHSTRLRRRKEKQEQEEEEEEEKDEGEREEVEERDENKRCKDASKMMLSVQQWTEAKGDLPDSLIFM